MHEFASDEAMSEDESNEEELVDGGVVDGDEGLNAGVERGGC
jgi:hypothetical protein